MSDMSFLPTLTAFLKEKGEIYTVRHFNYHSRVCNVEDVGRCDRRLISRVSAPIELEPYVSQSGFNSLLEWETAIRKFIKPTDDRFLYKVVVKK